MIRSPSAGERVSRLYADENFTFGVVVELRRLGHDAVTCQEAGRGNVGVPDEDVLGFATSVGRAVLTYNRRHFVRLDMLSPGHAGIVICTYDADYAALARRIDEALSTGPVLDGRVVRVRLPSR